MLFQTGVEIDFDQIVDAHVLIHPMTAQQKLRIHFGDATHLDLMSKADISQICAVAIARLDAARTILGNAHRMVAR